MIPLISKYRVTGRPVKKQRSVARLFGAASELTDLKIGTGQAGQPARLPVNRPF